MNSESDRERAKREARERAAQRRAQKEQRRQDHRVMRQTAKDKKKIDNAEHHRQMRINRRRKRDGQ